jgi:UDP-N-acetylmuramate dehydrogenase
MPLSDKCRAALRSAGVSFAEDVPLARKTWWRVGGPADAWAEVGDLAALQAIQRVRADEGIPVFTMGNASNLLVSDAGIRGLVIRLVDDLARVESSGDPPILSLGGGVKLVSLLGRAQREGWTGLEPLAGVPGTIGGAVRMNAGTRLGEVKDCLVSVSVVSPGGEVEEIPLAELAMAYRTCRLPEGAIVWRAALQTTGADPAASREAIAEHLAYRARTQPIDVPTCGSTFRNPPGDSAGRLLEAAGLKGFRVGAVEVSPKHANFVVNLGGATARDLWAVIEEMRRRVLEQSGIALEVEVHRAGEWASAA